ncbi:conserved hypothetical protein [Rhodococcus sp. RD6.2]|uniref:TIGR03086 family metal-binding protein n=1 Tax=Rhodococcus sp. RD6.2 TaxID=260936 RepID=UPI00063BCC21|nr:TIGR03086 family metal-binding protein [Rhodococcus sp. RD6.2]CRK54375.1 conserved hypothetical protein [Rhodococcus sp. RD6.2]
MTAGRVVPPLADPVALLGAAMRYTDAVLSRVTVGDLTSPTPCADWNLQELLAHMHESLVVLDEVALDRAVVLRPAAEAVVADPVAAVRGRGARLLRSWSRTDRGVVRVGGAALPSDYAAAAGALEVAVHGWDVSWALGTPTPVPSALATELLFYAEVFVPDDDREGRFAAPRVSSSPEPGERLLAFLGR